jgi:hypothetical protein
MTDILITAGITYAFAVGATACALVIAKPSDEINDIGKELKPWRHLREAMALAALWPVMMAFAAVTTLGDELELRRGMMAAARRQFQAYCEAIARWVKRGDADGQRKH